MRLLKEEDFCVCVYFHLRIESVGKYPTEKNSFGNITQIQFSHTDKRRREDDYFSSLPRETENEFGREIRVVRKISQQKLDSNL